MRKLFLILFFVLLYLNTALSYNCNTLITSTTGSSNSSSVFPILTQTSDSNLWGVMKKGGLKIIYSNNNGLNWNVSSGDLNDFTLGDLSTDGGNSATFFYKNLVVTRPKINYNKISNKLFVLFGKVGTSSDLNYTECSLSSDCTDTSNWSNVVTLVSNVYSHSTINTVGTPYQNYDYDFYDGNLDILYSCSTNSVCLLTCDTINNDCSISSNWSNFSNSLLSITAQVQSGAAGYYYIVANNKRFLFLANDTSDTSNVYMQDIADSNFVKIFNDNLSNDLVASKQIIDKNLWFVIPTNYNLSYYTCGVYDINCMDSNNWVIIANSNISSSFNYLNPTDIYSELLPDDVNNIVFYTKRIYDNSGAFLVKKKNETVVNSLTNYISKSPPYFFGNNNIRDYDRFIGAYLSTIGSDPQYITYNSYFCYWYPPTFIDVNFNLPKTGNFNSSINIDFNVSSSDKDDLLYAKLYYSNSSGSFQNLIISDLNLQAYCDDTNFLDSTHCVYTWNLSQTLDNNYFIDINVYNQKISFDTNYISTSILLDNNAPYSSWDGNNNSWQNTDANVHISCHSGTGSACQYIKYRKDLNPLSGITYSSWITYDSNILFDTNGEYYLQFYSVDDLNNVESTQTKIVKVDKENPIVSVSPDSNLSQSSNQITFYATVSDSFSGLLQCDYNIVRDGSVIQSNVVFPSGGLCSVTITATLINSIYSANWRIWDNSNNNTYLGTANVTYITAPPLAGPSGGGGGGSGYTLGKEGDSCLSDSSCQSGLVCLLSRCTRETKPSELYVDYSVSDYIKNIIPNSKDEYYIILVNKTNTEIPYTVTVSDSLLPYVIQQTEISPLKAQEIKRISFKVFTDDNSFKKVDGNITISLNKGESVISEKLTLQRNPLGFLDNLNVGLITLPVVGLVTWGLLLTATIIFIIGYLLYNRGGN